MKSYNIIFKAALGAVLVASMGSCSDDLKNENVSRDNLTSATPAQLLTTSELLMNPYGYGIWFTPAKVYMYTSQMAVPSGGISSSVIATTVGSPGIECIEQLKYLHALEKELSMMSAEEAASYAGYKAAMECLAIYMGLHDIDTTGDIPYTEGGRALTGGTIKPNYDSVEDLLSLWDKALAEAVTTLHNAPKPAVEGNAAADFAFGNDWSKWAKFANSLRVKLAVRYMSRDLAKAKSIVAECVASPAGLMTETADDMIFNKADANMTNTQTDRGDAAYGTTNTTITYNGISAAKNMVDFMLKNADPRVRFLYTKNNWNSKVVNYYLQNGYINAIPAVVLDRVNYEADGDNYKFVSWKGMGEPWVRYIGLPDDFGAGSSTDNALRQYFNYSDIPANGGNKISAEGADWSYRPYSMYNEEYLSGRTDFTVPRAPGDEVIQDLDDNTRYDMYMTAAEINLYLAEFATLGGVSGLDAASTYFTKAVRQSVEEWDRMAALNKIPYYGTNYRYDDNEKAIDLVDGEIDALLAQDDYKLTGDKGEDLEKIYLNLLIHFSYNPVDMWVTARRSGVPKFNSTLFPRTNYAQIDVTDYQRRSAFDRPSITDPMYDILMATYERQGFSLRNSSGDKDGYLNTERLWQDVGAPQYGEGPKVQ